MNTECPCSTLPHLETLYPLVDVIFVVTWFHVEGSWTSLNVTSPVCFLKTLCHSCSSKPSTCTGYLMYISTFSCKHVDQELFVSGSKLRNIQQCMHHLCVDSLHWEMSLGMLCAERSLACTSEFIVLVFWSSCISTPKSIHALALGNCVSTQAKIMHKS